MKTASITFRTTPEMKAFLKSQPKMSQWIEDACKAKAKADDEFQIKLKTDSDHLKNAKAINENVLQNTENVRQNKHIKGEIVRQKEKTTRNVRQNPVLEPLTKAVKPQNVRHSEVQPVIKTVTDAKKYDFEAMRKAAEEKRKTKVSPPQHIAPKRQE